MSEPSRSLTQRGFFDYYEITDTYGATVAVRPSSPATRGCVSVFIDGGDEEPWDGSRPNDGAVHLDVEQAKRLRDALDTFIAEHSD